MSSLYHDHRGQFVKVHGMTRDAKTPSFGRGKTVIAEHYRQRHSKRPEQGSSSKNKI